MKVAKNLSLLHIILSFIAILIILIPWYQLGISFPSFIAGGKIVIDSKYMVVGLLYIIIILLKFLEYKVEPTRKKDGKLIFALRNSSNKILIYGLLFILSYNGFLSIIFPVFLFAKDNIMETMKKLSADNGKMIEKSALGISEKVVLDLGIIFSLFYNLPFELWNVYFADCCIMIATIIGVINGCLYYFRAKELLMNEK